MAKRNKSSLVELAEENRQETVRRINEILSEICKLTAGSITAEIEGIIHQVIDLAAEIAVQFGVHPNALNIVYPNVNDSGVIGDEFHDCEDGNFHMGQTFVVDLVVVPGFEKGIMTRDSDRKTKQVIAACEIYPK